MSIETIIYLAEISTGVKLVFSLIAFPCLVGSVAAYTERDVETWMKIVFPAITCISLLFAVLIPTTKACYKIAGVSEQQKSMIDASGKVLEAKK